MLQRREFITAGLTMMGAALLFPAQSLARITREDVFYDKDAPVLGNPDGKVTVVEYFDYQCPYCKSSHPVLKKVVEEDGDVRLVLKDWPVFGGASVFAAQAVLGAAQIGKYETAMEALMKTKGKLTEDMVEAALTGAGLTMEELAAAVNGNTARISGLLDRNYDQALAFNFAGTPSFVIGSSLYPGVLDERALKAAIARARS
ncbi:Thiol:disulfide interchange protein DsbA precursor [Pannonibacter phragmitetus]|uniref:Thiol:disulfide interchange protein DsbA n=1 Tax=Pannonibacter phragmitetus TaxID=121719 RepID=A0A378ZTU9_9HYPH|nr:DsbA family protein [Pannonibacter phragmitetus]SUB00644.1 Thiol:disulfide interchange protein DsbA precursor [Pannonibacter phragmitetus]